MNSIAKIIKIVAIFVITIAIISAIYIYRNTISIPIYGLIDQINGIFTPPPCSQPVKYYIGKVDPEFKVSTEQVAQYLKKATSVWSDAAGKDLFEEDGTTGEKNVTINFIYDYRQLATGEMSKLGIVIKNDKETYNALKAKYDAIYPSYQIEKTAIQTAINDYNSKKNTYNDSVKYWNDQGGAPRDKFQQLEQTRAELNALSKILNEKQKAFSEMVDTVNSIVTLMNKLASELKLNVKTYNTIGLVTGEEFSEGEYVTENGTASINIYQYNDIAQLTRVLEHEFGHALGLNHVSQSGSIMYRLNDGMGDKLSEYDIAELKLICKMK